MDLTQLFLISVSIFAMLGSIALIVYGVLTYLFYKRFDLLAKKVDQIADKGIETSEQVKGFVSRTIDRLETFEKSIITFDAAKKLTEQIISAFQSNQKTKK